jgi:hypothetical protein
MTAQMIDERKGRRTAKQPTAISARIAMPIDCSTPRRDIIAMSRSASDPLPHYPVPSLAAIDRVAAALRFRGRKGADDASFAREAILRRCMLAGPPASDYPCLSRSILRDCPMPERLGAVEMSVRDGSAAGDSRVAPPHPIRY